MRLAFLLFLFGVVTADRDGPLPADAVSISEIDILIWNETTPAGLQASALRAADKKWPNARVPVKFDHSISTDERKIIAEAMGEIHQKTCVRFHNAVDSNRDFVLIVKPAYRSCSSAVGRQGGKQQLNLAAGCYYPGTVLHELMHALGFIHEHNRSDRDEYVMINWGMIREGQEHNFKKRTQSDLTLMDTPYSYDSVMHYPETLLSTDVRPTIVAKRRGVKLGGGDTLSPIDVLRINRYYGCPGADLETTPEPTRPTVPPKSEKDLSAEVAGRRVLKSTYGTYLRASLLENRVDLVSRADDWERWHIEDHGGKVVFKANAIIGRIMRGKANGHVDLGFTHHLAFVSMGWEKWTPLKNDDGSWSFRSAHGKWLSAQQDGSVTSVDSRSTSERFWLTSW